MRSTYYQSAENPVQVARLPMTRPTIEFLAPRKPWTEELGEAAAAISLMAAATFIALLLLRAGSYLDRLEPFDLLFCWPTLLAAAVTAYVHRNVTVICHPICLAAWVVASLSPQTPPLARVALIAVFTSVVIYLYGTHWVVIATASPVSRRAMYQCRTRCRSQLLVMGVVLSALVAISMTAQSNLPIIALAVLPLAILAMPASRGLVTNRCAVAMEALTAWLTYESKSLPGLVQSPIPSARHRWCILVVASVLSTVALNQVNSTHVLSSTIASQRPANNTRTTSSPTGYAVVAGVLHMGAVALTPIFAVMALITAASAPVLLDAAAERDGARYRPTEVTPALFDLRSSPDRIERRSILHGHVVSDGSPVLIPREVHMEHCHALGDSGSGKTALFLCPVIEQLVGFGDCSVIVLDLKGDSLELLAALQSASEAVGNRTGHRPPLKFFSNQRSRSTFAFNPLTQPYWKNFDLLTQTDILCAANGLTYGTDYGAGFFSSANAAITFHAIKTFPGVKTFAELADCIGTVLTVAKKRELHPEIRKAGIHVHEVIKRLAACEALNVTNTTGHSTAVVEQAIDLSQLFRDPQLLYCQLPATLTPSQAPEIARLFAYMLLAASTQTERRCPVFLVIDEFQRMVANNLEYMLQLARSMGVGVILANQSMQDLRKDKIDLIPAIEANCRLRQWFSVSSDDDQQRLIRSSGLTVETLASSSRSVNHEGRVSTSDSHTEHIAPRLTINDILLMNDHPFQSILRVSRGAGYAQFGGMPVVIQSRFHISQAEYERRKRLPWPVAEGVFQPRLDAFPTESAKPRSPSRQPGFQWSEEIIGAPDNAPLSAAGEQDLKTLFDSLRSELGSPNVRRPTGDES